MLNDFLFAKIKDEYIGNIWFQQDAAMRQTAEATLVVLRPVYEDRTQALKIQNIKNESLFGARHYFSKMSKEWPALSMAIIIGPC